MDYLTVISSPTEDAPRIPSALINVEDDFDRVPQESIPMLPQNGNQGPSVLARGDSDTDLDAVHRQPKEQAPQPPLATSPRRLPPQNTYVNLPAKSPRKMDAVSNPGYVMVYDKNRRPS